MHSHKLSLFALLVSGVSLLAGCSGKIDEDARWEKLSGQNGSPELQSTILIEEYTGQNCVNCPDAAELLHEQVSLHPDRVITVALHAKSTGQTRRTLENEEADRLFRHFSLPTAVPCIMVNRRVLASDGNRYSNKRALWPELISKSVSAPAVLRLSVEATHEDGTLTYAVTGSKATPSSPLPSRLSLTVWLVEDLYSGQKVLDKENPRFLHRNVLRKVLLEKKAYTPGTPVRETVRIAPETANLKYAKVVAFVSNAETEEILEAGIRALGKPIEESEGGGETGTDVPKPAPSLPLTFVCGDKAYKSGEEIAPALIAHHKEDAIELETSLISVKGGTTGAKYDVKVEAIDHKDEADWGFFSVCLEQCVTLEGLPKTYSYNDWILSPSSIVTVHLGLKGERQSKAETYRVRVTLSAEGKVAGTFDLRYDYVPERNPSTPVPPAPVPGPVPPVPAVPEKPAPFPEDNKDENKSNIVVMEFTAQWCPHCIHTMNDLHEQELKLNPHMILVVVHGIPTCYTEDLLGDDSRKAYNSHLGPGGYPTYFINNDRYSSEDKYDKFRERIEKVPLVKSKLSVERVGSDKVKVNFQSNPTSQSSLADHPHVKVLFWVVQNNIVAYQATMGTQYTHNNIFRGSLNGDWGTPYEPGKAYSETLSLPKVKSLLPDDCEVIAIVMDATSKIFLDAVKVEL